LRSGNKAHFGIPIEPRAPFLDYRVVEFAFQLPLEYLIHNGWHKWILRNAMQDLLPDSVVWRRAKMGFPFPLVPWLKMSRPIALGLISDSTCPYLDVRAVQSNYGALTEKTPVLLWRLLSLGLWWRRVIENRPLAV
jgi:asparagine synthase (glutamine-hydrolysing)